MINALIVLFAEALVRTAPYALAAMGGWSSERSGVMNIALEGKMLTAACVYALVGFTTHSFLFALLAALLSSILLSLLHWLVTQTYKVDQIISGMAINVLAAGATGFIAVRYLQETSGTLPVIPTVAVRISSDYIWHISPYVMLAWVLPFVLAWYVRRTRGGLRLSAVGNDPDKARLIGVAPKTVRAVALIATGVFTGVAGVLFVSNAGRFTEDMTAGSGFIGLAALILGGWRPLPALLAAFAFAVFDAMQTIFQGVHLFGITIPSQFWQSLPYVVTVVALAGFLGRSRAPAGLGKA